MSNLSFMTYRANRTRDQPPTLLECYGESNILTLFRFYMGMKDINNPAVNLPNFNFGPMVEAAARTCEKIDMFDNNEGLLDQVIFGVVYPDLCHPGLKDIAQDRELIALLLVRHFKNFGGLVLPPLAAALKLQTEHELVVRADVAAGRGMSQIHYPNWRQAQNMVSPPGFLHSNRGSRGRGRGGGNVGCGHGSTRDGSDINA